VDGQHPTKRDRVAACTVDFIEADDGARVSLAESASSGIL